MHAHEESWLETTTPSILVVDDDPAALRFFVRMLHRFGYQATGVTEANQALVALASRPHAAVVIDIKMPDHDGLWLLERIREQHPTVSAVMLTGWAELDSALVCLRRGATDYLTKPVRPTRLLEAVKAAVHHHRFLSQRTRDHQAPAEVSPDGVPADSEELASAYLEVKETYDQTLEALCSALDAREAKTADHSRRVMHLTLEIARACGLHGQELAHLGRAALLHDIGKIGVPDQILHKPGPLDPDEWQAMKRHPEIGYQILAKIPFLRPAATIVLSHHEKWDGSGYPHGLKGNAIPLGARVFTVADTLDAMTSDRFYRTAVPIRAALTEINDCAGGQFDPAIVEVVNSIELVGALGTDRQSRPIGS